MIVFLLLNAAALSWTKHGTGNSLSRQLGHRLSSFNRILHMLDKQTRLAYFNGLVPPHLDYADSIWGDQRSFRFAKKIAGSKLSPTEALVSLKWFPLCVRRFGHRCLTVQNAIKGDIPEHFEIFMTPLSQ